jgi:tRNA 5-methylaminomethyl-2-thiouridine biosynthesis bifunctional protein
LTPDAPALLQASALPERWRGQADHQVLMSDFGLASAGLAFVALWQAWRDDPHRPGGLTVFSPCQQLPTAADLPPRLAASMAGVWPPPTANFHGLAFENGRVRLLLAVGMAQPLRQVRQLQADTLWIDASQVPRPRALGRLAAPGARLLLWHAATEQREALRAAGFVHESSGPAGLEHWRHAPRPGMRQAPARPTERQAVVIGAGIAGACAAAALAQRGWACTVLDAHAQPAGGASGNPAALCHGTVHAADGAHARFTRAAALQAQRLYAGLLARGVPGALQGLLRAQAEAVTPAPPATWAQAWAAGELQVRGSGLQADSAWFFPGAGWVDAAATVHALLATPGVQFQGRAAAARLRREDDHWCVLDAQGQALARAPIVVLALAAASGAQSQGRPGLTSLLSSAGALAPPLARTRGQVTWFDHLAPALPWPVAGGGYALHGPLAGTPSLLCGATTQADDEDPEIRASDHAHNLTRLQSLTGLAPAPGTRLQGRVGWRERTPDRLPVAGPLPAAAALAAGSADPQAGRGQLTQARHLPRVQGLFMLGAMAGRGFTWGPLAGELLASLVDGSLLPLEGDLVDALDPGRFWLRQQRRASG